jgi:hypothetical protein
MSDEKDRPTFNDYLDDKGHLPDASEADRLVEHLSEIVYDEEGSGFAYTDVALTYRPARGSDYERIVNRERTGGLQYGRVKPTIGFQKFWHPILAPIPVVTFKREDGEHTEWVTETVHPRLVAGGRDEVMEQFAHWIFYEIHEMTAHLSKMLQWLAVARENERISTEWPKRMNEEPGSEWGADPDDRIPSIGSEETAQKVSERYPDHD